MPWTVENPPDVVKNQSPSEIEDCVSAANAVLEEGGDEEEAIYACLHAAGMSEERGRGMTIKSLWREVTNLFRAIKEVSEWNGEPSRWEDTAAYCDDCLIDLNGAVGNEDPDLAYCKLPIREPGDGDDTYVAEAIYAAAGGRGLQAVEKPEDVSAEDWEDAKRSAANKIIQAYEEMDEVAPESIYSIAGRDVPQEGGEPGERAIAIADVWEQVHQSIYGDEDLWDAWLQDLYVDAGIMYAIVASGGKLYRVPISTTDTGVVLGEWEQVIVNHQTVSGEVDEEPMRSRGLTVIRQQDGRYRWVGVASTAYLNRVGEIDSTQLYQSFLDRFNPDESPVTLDFYHLPLDLGSVDYLDRDGYVLLASGLFDDTPVGRAAAEGLMSADPGEWGLSIQYDPLTDPELWEVAEGIMIPVFLDGALTRMALLPERMAAANYTNIFGKEVSRMRDYQVQALAELLGDEEQARLIAEQLDTINSRGVDEHAIARTGEATPESPESPSAAVGEETEVIVEIGDEDLQAFLDRTLASEEFTQLTQDVQTTGEQLRDLGEAVQGLVDLLESVEARLGALEREDEERLQQYADDMPRQVRTVKYRPREERRSAEDEMVTSDEIAGETLKKVPAAY